MTSTVKNFFEQPTSDDDNALVLGGTVKGSSGAQSSNIPVYDITWTMGEPTAGDSATIADGAAPTAAETGQAIADLTAKLNLVIAALANVGIIVGP